MKTYRLFVKNGDEWQMACTVQAIDADSAKREAILLLKPEDRKKKLRLVEEGKSTGARSS